MLSRPQTLVAAFHGHGSGGEDCSHFALHTLPDVLAAHLALNGSASARAGAPAGAPAEDASGRVVASLTAAFSDTDGLLQEALPADGFSGASATAVLVRGGRAHIAWVGAVSCMLGRRNADCVVPETLTQPHRPETRQVAPPARSFAATSATSALCAPAPPAPPPSVACTR